MSEPRVLPSWIGAYLDYTHQQEGADQFQLWTGITILAGALDRHVYIDRGYNKLYPNFYTILVAPTGGRKSSAMGAGVYPFLEHVDSVHMLYSKTTPEGLIDFLQNGGEMKSTGGLKYVQECTAFIYASELKVLLGQQNYTQGLIELLTDLWDQRVKWEYITKTAGTTNLANVNLNILAGSNPEWLAHALREDSFGGGFLGRCIFVYADTKRKKVADPKMGEEEKLLELALLADLQKIAKLHGEMKFTFEAAAFYKDWYENKHEVTSGRLAGYLDRKPTHLLKLGMILSAQESDSLKIGVEHLKRALFMLEGLEQDLASAFAYIGATNEARIAQQLVDAMRSHGGKAPRQYLFRKVRHLLRSAREFDLIIQTLEESGIVEGVYLSDNARTHMYAVKALAQEWLDEVKTKQALTHVDEQPDEVTNPELYGPAEVVTSTEAQTQTQTQAPTPTVKEVVESVVNKGA